MKKSLSLFIIAFIALITSINANAWTDRNTFNLKGPVENVYDDINGNLYFEEDGTYIPQEEDFGEEQVIYNNSNKIESITIPPAECTDYKYNNKGQVTKTNLLCGNSDLTVTKYTYNTKGYIIKQIEQSGWSTTSGFKVKSTITTTYTYQKFDKYGNWIKRTAKTGRKSAVETRTITYYE